MSLSVLAVLFSACSDTKGFSPRRAIDFTRVISVLPFIGRKWNNNRGGTENHRVTLSAGRRRKRKEKKNTTKKQMILVNKFCFIKSTSSVSFVSTAVCGDTFVCQSCGLFCRYSMSSHEETLSKSQRFCFMCKQETNAMSHSAGVNSFQRKHKLLTYE